MAARVSAQPSKRDLRIERKSNMWRITVYKIHDFVPHVKRHFFILI